LKNASCERKGIEISPFLEHKLKLITYGDLGGRGEGGGTSGKSGNNSELHFEIYI